MQAAAPAGIMIRQSNSLFHGQQLITEVRKLMPTMAGDATIDQIVETLKFLSDRNRLRIIAALTREETCVCDLIEELALPQSLVSYHLSKLRKGGLVRARRQARWIYYSLDSEAWRALTLPLEPLFWARDLSPDAAYGASRRCDSMPPDSELGACTPQNGAIDDCC